MMFPTRIRGIPCQVDVTEFSDGKSALLLSNGECFPPEPEVFEYEVYNLKGYKIQWLKDLVDDKIERQLRREFSEVLDSYDD